MIKLFLISINKMKREAVISEELKHDKSFSNF